MNRKNICVSILIISFAAIIACGSGQQLHIESNPSGAEVYLMRRGEYEVNASIDGIGGSVDGDSFEEEFYLLGTTPLEYEFNLSDTESSFYIPGIPAGVSTTKHFHEGILRVEMDGYETEQRTIQFSNNLAVALAGFLFFRLGGADKILPHKTLYRFTICAQRHPGIQHPVFTARHHFRQ